MAIINLNNVATDNTTDEILVRASNGDIRKVSKASIIAAGGAQDLQSVLDNGSEGYVDTDITLTHGTGMSRASMGLSDGNAMLEAGETTPNQFIVSPTTAELKSNLKIEPSVNPEDAVQRQEVEELITEAGSASTLQSVTNNGNSTTNDITIGSLITFSAGSGRIEDDGGGVLIKHPAYATLGLLGGSGDAIGVDDIHGAGVRNSTNVGYFRLDNIEALDPNPILQFPNQSGTIALLSDVGTPATLESVINNDGTASFSGNFSITRIVSSDVKNFINFDTDVDQTNINGKAGVNIGAPTGVISLSGNINVPNQTATTLVYLDSSKNLVTLPTATYPSPAELAYSKGTTSNVQTQINAKAPSVSPALTGNPTAPTQSAGDNSTKIATTAYADAKVQNSLAASTSIAPSSTFVKSYIDAADLTKITNGGDTTGATMNIGSNDAQTLSLRYNGSSVLSLTSTSNLQVVNGGTISNATVARGQISIGSATGSPMVMRNTADAIPAWTMNLQNASSTGDIALFQFQGTNVAKVLKTGDIEVLTATAGIILKSPNGNRWRVTISDAGVLTTTTI